MYVYAHLYLGFLEICLEDWDYNKHEWRARGLMYLADCYYALGMYEIRLNLLREAYALWERSKNNFNNSDRCLLKLMSTIFTTEKQMKK